MVVWCALWSAKLYFTGEIIVILQLFWWLGEETFSFLFMWGYLLASRWLLLREVILNFAFSAQSNLLASRLVWNAKLLLSVRFSPTWGYLLALHFNTVCFQQLHLFSNSHLFFCNRLLCGSLIKETPLWICWRRKWSNLIQIWCDYPVFHPGVREHCKKLMKYRKKNNNRCSFWSHEPESFSEASFFFWW